MLAKTKDHLEKWWVVHSWPLPNVSIFLLLTRDAVIEKDLINYCGRFGIVFRLICAVFKNCVWKSALLLGL